MPPSPSDPRAFLIGKGEMRGRIRDMDWATTALGPIEGWSAALRVAVGMMLDSPFPTILYWGPELVALYNDAYRPHLGKRHVALGLRLEEIWGEAMDDIAPVVARALAGEGSRHHARRFVLLRNGVPEEAWFDYVFSPVRDEHGAVVGILNSAFDVTHRIAQQRRQAFLLALGDALVEEEATEDIPGIAARMLGEHLGVRRVHYAEALPDRTVRIREDYRDGVPSVAGVHRLEDFGPELLSAYQAGQTVVQADVLGDPELGADARSAYTALGVAAFVAVPLVRNRQLAAILAVHDAQPRRWRPEEVRLIEETARRTWDAVERAHAEDALRRSEQRYRTLFHSIDQAFCLIEVIFSEDGEPVDYRFLESNPVFDQQTGLGDPVGRTARELVPDLEERWFRTYGRVARTGEPLRFQGQATPLGRWFDVFAFPFSQPDGRRVALLFKDITASREAQEALRRSEAQLQEALEHMREADRRKDEFLATLAHELRNPLAPLRHGVEILRRSGDASPAARRVREMMGRQVHHMRRLVDDLLEVSRITRGKMELRRERVELAAALRSAVETVAPQLKTAGHSLQVSLPDEPLVVDADPVRLAQVFANLLDNAVKYTEPGGRVTLIAERLDRQAVVTVRDTGVGIAPEVLPHVFDMFTQASRGEASGDGLGIGLTLVHGLVQMHGGTIEARSEGRGAGTEVTVRLPLAGPPEADREARGEGVALDADLRVLVVDDNPDVAESLGLLLELMGPQVRVASDGARALDVVAEWEPHVVLLDLGMPGLDGVEVARRIRGGPRGGSTTLVAVTGWGQEEDRRRTRDAGFDHHLVKPVDLDLLEELLGRVVPEGR